jgi:predicted CXXCH cytochrome family protein
VIRIRPSLSVLVLLLLAAVSRAQSGKVKHSPHNLSASGTGPIRAGSEDAICIFCHTAHNASATAPLWNRRNPVLTYTTYESSTLKSVPGQPTGTSRLCLSCHDGTIALGDVRSRRGGIPMTVAGPMPTGRSKLGLDLSDDHPISMSYQEAVSESGGTLRPTAHADGRPLVGEDGQVQCTSCHDPHDNSFGQFLRTTPVSGALCLSCHDPLDWAASSHATSGASWDGPKKGPKDRPDMTNVATFACRACHVVHEAPAKRWLLHDESEEEVCYACHATGPAQHDIRAEMRKWRSHDPSRARGVRDPAVPPDGSRRAAECVDCHNPHRSNSKPGDRNALPGSIRGVSGYSSSKTPVAVATHEYEICYKCHASMAESDPNRIVRQADQASVLMQFDPGNPSYHPVVAAGRNQDVPSLIPPLTPASIVTCGDCHGNDNPQGPKGPHGSRWDYLLRFQYETADPTTETFASYALCYECHQRASILADQSFRYHRLHIVDERTSCATCHAAHGIDPTVATAGDHTHLINFKTAVVEPNSQGELFFRDEGRYRGTCSLLCHGENHVNTSYSR